MHSASFIMKEAIALDQFSNSFLRGEVGAEDQTQGLVFAGGKWSTTELYL